MKTVRLGSYTNSIILNIFYCRSVGWANFDVRNTRILIKRWCIIVNASCTFSISCLLEAVRNISKLANAIYRDLTSRTYNRRHTSSKGVKHSPGLTRGTSAITVQDGTISKFSEASVINELISISALEANARIEKICAKWHTLNTDVG